MNVVLSARMESLIRDQLATGRYRDEGEVVQEALQLLAERGAEDRLREEVLLGFAQIERGEAAPYSSELMERLRREAAAAARQGKPFKNAVVP